uniref:Uncharacterized protein n=1 Tax=Utricularia reniformis TaxID=192314 RepID=A0A1Y0AYR3_9LAMI|nr:hypothetical protein AEK19_MT0467 [Utricularia reniformis]ART30290.1 hypothetical protein AEK19_MT0467 [Utricularia reniformis]
MPQSRDLFRCLPIIQVSTWHHEQKSIEEGGSRDQFPRTTYLLFNRLLISICAKFSRNRNE